MESGSEPHVAPLLSLFSNSEPLFDVINLTPTRGSKVIGMNAEGLDYPRGSQSKAFVLRVTW